jgi:hypothetical protein
MKLFLIWTSLVIIAVSLVASTGCGGSKKTEPTGPLPSADEVLSKASQAFSTLETFHFRLEHENGASPIPTGLKLETADGNVVVPDRMYAKLEAKAGTQPVRVEVIGVGQEGWITNPFTRKWQPLPSGTTIDDIFDPTKGVEAVISALENAQVTAEEKVDGVVTYRIEGTVPSEALEAAAPIAEPGFTVRITAWIGKDDSLMRRVYLTGPIAPDEADNIIRKLTISEFGADIEITPPAVESP